MLSYFDPVINFLRILLPVISLFGSAPTFFVFWFSLRFVTLFGFTRHIYRRCDDYLYSIYQRFVLFFFENWVNVKVYFMFLFFLLHFLLAIFTNYLDIFSWRLQRNN